MLREEMGRWASIVDFPGADWQRLSDAVEQAYAAGEVYPPREDIFAALRETPPEDVKAVIIGQDPYHEPGQAHGLSFSVKPGVPIPKSLKNIYKEREADLGLSEPEDGCLLPWARQGVLLLNTALTVEAHKANSHRGLGWDRLTDSIIRATNALPQPIVFILWGAFAVKKGYLAQTDAPRLKIISPHPSPLSAYRGFFGSRPFSRTNEFLTEHGSEPIKW